MITIFKNIKNNILKKYFFFMFFIFFCKMYLYFKFSYEEGKNIINYKKKLILKIDNSFLSYFVVIDFLNKLLSLKFEKNIKEIVNKTLDFFKIQENKIEEKVKEEWKIIKREYSFEGILYHIEDNKKNKNIVISWRTYNNLFFEKLNLDKNIIIIDTEEVNKNIKNGNTK